jgi:hypothetical protein
LADTELEMKNFSRGGATAQRLRVSNNALCVAPLRRRVRNLS